MSIARSILESLTGPAIQIPFSRLTWSPRQLPSGFGCAILLSIRNRMHARRRRPKDDWVTVYSCCELMGCRLLHSAKHLFNGDCSAGLIDALS
jgi:hypothetical protein